jgi:hypothetical protein
MQESQSQPYIRIIIKAHANDYKSIGFTLRHPSQTIKHPAIADTECQSCLAGVKIIQLLGLQIDDL